jgi:Holliday junction DNA helicase RuvA
MEKSEREILDFIIGFRNRSIARTMLSSLDPKQITNAIASLMDVTIQSIKGIGSKTAQRVYTRFKEKC